MIFQAENKNIYFQFLVDWGEYLKTYNTSYCAIDLRQPKKKISFVPFDFNF